MSRFRLLIPVFAVALVLGIGGLMNGCTDNPVATGPGVQVNLAASFSNTSMGLPLSKAFGTAALDSIRIDSVVVVIEKIKFYANIDTVSIDSTGSPDDELDGDHDSSLIFRGPFVIHVRDTLAINFADQILPAGDYNGVQFKIHRLQRGEMHEDSDERHDGNHGMVTMPADSMLQGSSIVIWGAVKENGTWTDFELDVDMELQFKIKGDFTVPEGTGSIQFAFHFDLASWFVDPDTGMPIDPSDPNNMQDIKRAIRHAFGSVRCGHDWNHDGYPDH